MLLLQRRRALAILSRKRQGTVITASAPELVDAVRRRRLDGGCGLHRGVRSLGAGAVGRATSRSSAP